MEERKRRGGKKWKKEGDKEERSGEKVEEKNVE